MGIQIKNKGYNMCVAVFGLLALKGILSKDEGTRRGTPATAVRSQLIQKALKSEEA